MPWRQLLINVEAQKSFYPGYQIVTRGIFYDTRMISAQLGTEFSIPDYDSIKKVYSIWICFNAPNYIGNAISEYYMTKRDIVPGIPNRPWAYDKISVVQITLNEKLPSGHKLLSLLNTIFSTTKSFEKKKQILQEEYGICMNHSQWKELNTMCNISEYIMEHGLEQGKYEIIKNLLISKLLSIDAIAAVSGYSPEKILAIRQELLKN